LNSGRNWLGVMFGALFYIAQRPGHYENWSGSIWRASKVVLEKNGKRKQSINEVLESIGEKGTLLHNVLHKEVNWVGHVLRKNCFLHDVIE